MARYLTKSRFKLALECPVKLYYTGKAQYLDKKSQDDFLEALAEGGFQVGELAKLYYPEGVEITERDYEIPVSKTKLLLEKENVVIFEAGFRSENLFVRTDIIVKTGNSIHLVEVKSKSFQGDDANDMIGKKGGISSGWKPYLFDVAFQKYVVKKAFPHYNIKAYLMLADTEKKASVNGLNQKFLIRKDNKGKVYVEKVGDTSILDLGDKILNEIDVDDIVEGIISGRYGELESGMDFASSVQFYADMYNNDQIINKPIGAHCNKCEFDCPLEDENPNHQSGYRNCWRNKLNWTNSAFRKPHIFELWNFRKKQYLIDEGIYHISDLTKDMIGRFELSKDGKISTNERQWLQVEMTNNNTTEPFLDIDGIKDEICKWVYPLHFIDFETNRVAIPFHKNRKPYEGIAFQFSHHTVDSNGLVKHIGEFINVTPGVFPNYDFIRELRNQLSLDNGTIFRYADHENAFLVEIWRQLREESDSDVPDRKVLLDFIKTITHSSKDNIEQWVGGRDMVDLLQLVKNYFYHISMKGSNSIKVVLPAVLETSLFLNEKYSKPIYGVNGGIESKNFKDFIWYKRDNTGKVINPYKLLQPVFKDMTVEETEDFTVDETIAGGGAAMTAYARMQFTRMGETERKLAKEALLRYCELDTLAMVMIYEYWIDQVNK